ncbi:MAG: hypothetical protein C1943_05245 [Halochromatium sp.]|nr:hypothetical protein [Halochromatium sp.]
MEVVIIDVDEERIDGVEIAAETARSFVDHDDGTVSDLNTGLMWTKCSLGQSGPECGTGDPSLLTWQAAQEQAALATSNGHEDWRVPSIKELTSLVDYDAYWPAIDTQIFPQTPTIGRHWSSTSYVANPESAWRVYFAYGFNGGESKGFQNLVRLVRAGQTPLLNGEPLAGLSDVQGHFRLYTIAVPGDASQLEIRTEGGTGDVDLYVSYGQPPSVDGGDCFPEENGNAETCTFQTPQEGLYFIELYAFDSFSGVTLTASYAVPAAYPLTVSREGTGSGAVNSIEEVKASGQTAAGEAQPRIVGGTDATLGDWPWQVAIRDTNPYPCGGSLLSSEWVVSAAHCFFDGDNNPINPANFTVRAGSVNLDTGGEERNISEIITHPNYNHAGSSNHDIALVRLASPVSGAHIGTIVPLLPAREPSLATNGVDATVTGWGSTNANGSEESIAQTLQEVSVPYMDTEACRETGYSPSAITDNMICAGLPEGGKDACFGDSGGPLVVSDTQGGYRLAGIVSFGNRCARANFPGVYTRVARYTDWIEQHTGLDFNPARIQCGADCSAYYDEDMLVTLEAVSDEGSTFTGWDGACTGTDPQCMVTLDQARSLTATFELDVVTWDIQTSASQGGAITCDPDPVPDGQDSRCEADAEQGYVFDAWSGDCSGNNPTCLLETVSSDKTVEALFLADSDGDGVPDVDDAFPEDPNESADGDGDNLGDNQDNCPDLSNPDQADSDGDGIGDACELCVECLPRWSGWRALLLQQ